MTQTTVTLIDQHQHHPSCQPHTPPELNGTSPSYEPTPALSTLSDGAALSDTAALSANGDVDVDPSSAPRLLRLEDVFVQGTEEEREEAQQAVDRINAVRIRAHKRHQASLRRQSLQTTLAKSLAEEEAINAQLEALAAQRRFVEEERSRLLTQAEELFARHRELAEKKVELIQNRTRLMAEIAGAVDTVHSSVDVPLLSSKAASKVKRSVNVVAPSDTHSVASVPVMPSHSTSNGPTTPIQPPFQPQADRAFDRPSTVGSSEQRHGSRTHFSLRRRSGANACAESGSGFAVRSPRPTSFIWRRASMPISNLTPADLTVARRRINGNGEVSSQSLQSGTTTANGSHPASLIRGRGGVGAHLPPSRSATDNSIRSSSFLGNRLSLLVPKGSSSGHGRGGGTNTPTGNTPTTTKKRMDILAFYAMGGGLCADDAGESKIAKGDDLKESGREEEEEEEVERIEDKRELHSRRAAAIEV